jgi:sec-independent protein translocase protein TatA
MFGFHAWDLLIVLLILLLIFGARRLPELGSSLGQSYKMLQKGLNGSNQREAESEQESEQSPQAETRKESER